MCYLFGLEYVGAVIEPCHDEAAKRSFALPAQASYCIVLSCSLTTTFFFFFFLSFRRHHCYQTGGPDWHHCHNFMLQHEVMHRRQQVVVSRGQIRVVTMGIGKLSLSGGIGQTH